MDGEVSEERQPKNAPLTSFVKHLLTHGGFDGDRKFVADLRYAQFRTPPGFNQNFTFHPIGIDGATNPIVTQTSKRAICVSPFVHHEAIRILRQNVSGDLILLGRREELRR